MTIKHDSIAKLEALRQKAISVEEERQKAAKEKAEENRRRMPQVTAWVDQARAIFGDDVKVMYCKENGIEMGRKLEGGISMAETSISGSFSRAKTKR